MVIIQFNNYSNLFLV